MVVTGIQSLNDDVLSLIDTQLSQRDAAQLMRTSRALKGQARRRVLSSSKVTAPSQILRFYKFLVEEDDGYRLQCLQKLTIYRSNLPINEPAGGYPPLLAHILRQARSLHTLVVSSTEDHLQNNPVIGDAIAGLRNLQELHLYDVAGEAIRLCGRLTCEPRVVHLAARCSAARPSYGVDRAAFCALPMFQSASVVSLCDFALTREDPLSLDTPTKWPATHTLRLKNVDPIALAAVCPNLSHLQIAFCWHADDAHVAYPYDGHYPYSALAQELTTQIRVLDTFVDNEESMLDHTISSTIQGTHPVVLSTQFGYGDTSLWSSIAEVLRQPGSRTRYLDVLMHDEAEKGQQWLVSLWHFVAFRLTNGRCCRTSAFLSYRNAIFSVFVCVWSISLATPYPLATGRTWTRDPKMSSRAKTGRSSERQRPVSLRKRCRPSSILPLLAVLWLKTTLRRAVVFSVDARNGGACWRVGRMMQW